MTDKKIEPHKELTEINKPFPFFDLPHEIRQQIYTYSLYTGDSIDIKPYGVSFVPESFKPPAPGLLRANKQIYDEAIDVVYSKNIFKFFEPEHILAFEKKIGPENCKRVRDICVHITFPTAPNAKVKRKHLPELSCDTSLCPWIAALDACSFEKVVHFCVDAWVLYPSSEDMLIMPKNLQESIERFLARVVPEHQVPRLSLIGFQWEERKKLPEKWEVTMMEWDWYEMAINACELDWWNFFEEDTDDEE